MHLLFRAPGPVSSVGPELASEAHELPWLELGVGAVLGALVYGLTAAVDGESPHAAARASALSSIRR